MFCLPSTTSAVHFPWPTPTRTRHATRALRVCGWAFPGTRPCTDLAPGVGLDSARRPRRREFRKALHPGSRPRRNSADGSPASLPGWSPGPAVHVCGGPNIGAAMRGGGSAAVDAATPAITPTHSPELPYAGQSRRPRPRVARRPAVTQTGSPRCPGVGEYSEGVTGVNILPLLSTPQASVGAQFARRRRYGRRGQKPSDMRLMRGGHWRPTESVLSGTRSWCRAGDEQPKGRGAPVRNSARGRAEFRGGPW